MPQRDTLRELDDDIMDSLMDEGWADEAIYQAPGTPAPAAVECRVYVDRNVEFAGEGELGEVVGVGIEVTLLRAEVARPVPRATVTVGAETFILRREVESDESVSVWEVALVPG